MIRVLLLCLLLGSLQAKEIFVDYGRDQEGSELFKYFYDIEDQIYVEIGAYHPIHKSNTQNLDTRGWRGIEVDASPERIAPFFYMRPGQTNLNVAIGQEDTFVILHDMKKPGSSTVSDGAFKALERHFKNGSTGQAQEVKIASLSMKQLCERFYEKRPLYLSIDIEGYDGFALSKNDWKNPKCRPDVIFTEQNGQTRNSKLVRPIEVLTANGYKQFGEKVGMNLVFVEEKVFSKYEAKVKKGTELVQKMRVVSVDEPSEALAKKIGVETKIFDDSFNLYDPKTDPIYYFFATKARPVVIEDINHQSNWLSKGEKNRPIVVYHYDPHLSYLIVPTEEYQVEKMVAGIFRFWKLSFKGSNGESLTTYVLNHEIEPLMELQIVPLKISEKVIPQETQATAVPCLDTNETLKQISKDMSILVAANDLAMSKSQALQNERQITKNQILYTIQTSETKLQKLLHKKNYDKIMKQHPQQQEKQNYDSLQGLKTIIIAFMIFTSLVMGLCVFCLIDLRSLQRHFINRIPSHSDTVHEMDTQ